MVARSADKPRVPSLEAKGAPAPRAGAVWTAALAFPAGGRLPVPKVGISPRLEPSPGGETGPHGGTRLSRPATAWAAALRPGPGLMHLSSCSRELGELSGKWSRVATRCAQPRWWAGARWSPNPAATNDSVSPNDSASPDTCSGGSVSGPASTPADDFCWVGFFKFAFKNKKQKHIFF